MKKIFTLTLLAISLITTAQNTATPNSIQGKDIYALLINTTPHDFVENIELTMNKWVLLLTLITELKRL